MEQFKAGEGKTRLMIIHSRLLNDEWFQNVCLLALYGQQLDTEKGSESTHHENGKGFNKADAPVLSPLAQYLIDYSGRRGGTPFDAPLSTLEREELSKRLPKYARQLVGILGEEDYK